MKSVTIRELRHETARVLARVGSGERLEIRRRRQPVAVISPCKSKASAPPLPDFSQRMQSVYGAKPCPSTATENLQAERGSR